MTRSELERIEWGPEPGQPVGGIGTIRIVAHCQGDAELVLARTKELLSMVLAREEGNWPSDEEWVLLLPDWFVSRCPPKPGADLVKKMLSLPAEARSGLEDRFWSVDSWVYWLQPENRHWYWWDGMVVDANEVIIALEVSEWPFPWGDLKWLLRAAGAISVEAEP